MKWIRLIALIGLTYGFVWALSTSFTAGSTQLPAFGQLLNPFDGFWRNAEPANGPVLPQQVALPGLIGKVEVLYDDLLIPHVFAENMTDAVMVQGYITAQNRLFQMELTARKIDGRLSEIIGERTLPIDLKTRRKGLPWAAEKDLAVWEKSDETLRLLNAYTQGVNAWIEQLSPADYPVEYKILGCTPEPWSNYKSVLVVEGMADMLANYDDDLAATNAAQVLGEALYQDLYQVWNPKQLPVVPPPYDYAKGGQNPAAGLKTGESLGYFPGGPCTYPETDPVINGSNNWALAGKKTASGRPLLANDPHLSLTLPSIWYQIQLHTTETNTCGVSLPGLPGVVIGFNEHVAWGITNVGADVTDWYKMQWTDAGRTAYLLDGAPVKAELRVEQVRVKGKKAPVTDTIRYTVWGPVCYNDPSEPMYDCALRWSPHDAGDYSALSRFTRLNLAKQFADYEEGVKHFDAPAQNIIFADKNGDIGIRVQGNLPIRQGTEGRFIRDGARSSEKWAGFIPQDELPQMHNPERGFVTSANQNSTDPNYPYYFPYGSWDQFRGRNAVMRLEKMQGATVDSMKAMQYSAFSLRAKEATTLLLGLLDRSALNTAQQAQLKTLSSWDFQYLKDATAPTLFELWFDSTYALTFDEMHALRLQKIQVQFPETWRFLQLLEKDTTHQIFDRIDTPEKETARQMVTEAFKRMSAQALQESAKGNLEWGKFQPLSIHHIARIAPFSQLNIPANGHKSALNALMRDHGPSWRMIVDLGNTVQAIGVYPGGQSGNPGSRFYDNMVRHWLEGEYYPIRFWKSASEAASGEVYGKTTFIQSI